MTAKVSILSPEDAERFRAFERRRHDALAESYQDFFAGVTARAIEPLLAAVALGPGSRLLDVATGAGSLAAEAVRRGALASGIDLSPNMVALATRRHPGIDFRVGEVEHLPFTGGSFDVVVCSFGLGHFPLPEASVAECVRTLKPGGGLAFSWWDGSSRQGVQGTFREAIAEVGAAPPPDIPKGHSTLRFCDADEFRRLLEGAGLDEVAVQDHRATHIVPDVETFWRGGLGGLAVTASAIAHQDAATQEAIRVAFVRRAAAYQTANGLEVPIAFRVAAGCKPR